MRHLPHHWFGRLIGLVLLVMLAAFAGRMMIDTHRATERQEALELFYQTPADVAKYRPGEVIRSEAMDAPVPNGRAVRVLYRSELQDGTPNVSSGMVFIPDSATPEKPVVAWAHGTIGLGAACAPSRSEQPLNDMDWLGGMMAQGWVVTATDYAGLGTDGPKRYLVGQDEARDVLNSVRAARQLEPSSGARFALWGHSQGGHSVLFSSTEAAQYAPELRLVASAAGAPAAELVPLFSQQYASAAAWIIGPDVLVSWPGVYPGLDTSGTVSQTGQKVTDKLADECIGKSAGAALFRHALGQQFFSSNPMGSPSWVAAATAQTPPVLSAGQPLLVVQSLTDQVVLPDTTARLIQQSCQAGVLLQTVWLDQVTHQATAVTAGPSVTNWLSDRFTGRPVASSCNQPSPITPAT